MDNIAKGVKLAVEGLLENESLTAGLNEKAAQNVLDWGMEITQQIVRGTAELDDQAAEEATYPRLRAARRMMRDMSRFVAVLPQADADELTPLLDELVGYAETIFGPNYVPPLPEERRIFAERLVALRDEPVQAVTRLRHFLQGPASLPEVEADVDPMPDEPELDSDFTESGLE